MATDYNWDASAPRRLQPRRRMMGIPSGFLERVQPILLKEQQVGLVRGAQIRIAVLAGLLLVDGMIALTLGTGWGFRLTLTLTLFMLGVAQLLIFMNGGFSRSASLAAPVIDSLFVLIFLTSPAPLYDILPAESHLVLSQLFVYFYIFVAQSVFSLAPLQVLWATGCSLVAWLLIAVDVSLRPGAMGLAEVLALDPARQIVDGRASPHFVPVYAWIDQAVLLIGLAAAFAITLSWLTRRLSASAWTSAARASLSRYVAPTFAEAPSDFDGELFEPARRNVAILSFEISRFDDLTGTLPPEEVLKLLKGFRERVVAEAHRFEGVIQPGPARTFQVAFGAWPTDETPAAAARQCYDCAQAILSSIASWNAVRRASGEQDIRVNAGAHFGPAVVGDLGQPGAHVIIVSGEATSAARNLVREARDQDAKFICSGEFMDRLRLDRGRSRAQFGMERVGRRMVAGLSVSTTLWMLRSL